MRMNHSDVNNVAANADVRMDLESERGDLNKLPNPKGKLWYWECLCLERVHTFILFFPSLTFLVFL